jgi:MoxR-like ATPase
MDYPFYVGDGRSSERETPAQLPRSRRDQLNRPEGYLADPGLVDAANVALLLNQPLLLTGEPGTGKTSFANSLANELGLGSPLKFETKSNSNATDLFYLYDALKRFQDQDPEATALRYLTFQPLGEAILRTRKPEEVQDFLSDEFTHSDPVRSVVLIDEVDKAPRDFPNDLLNELEQMYFRIPELGKAVIEANRELMPVIVITSNSEKDLPDAFLRRCIYYNIPFPEPDRLRQIIANRLGDTLDTGSEFVNDALELFHQLRLPSSGLRKKPATAELLGWLISMQQIAGTNAPSLDEDDLPLRSLSNLVKTKQDQDIASELIRAWLQKSP